MKQSFPDLIKETMPRLDENKASTRQHGRFKLRTILHGADTNESIVECMRPTAVLDNV